jgi:hypothetical protein
MAKQASTTTVKGTLRPGWLVPVAVLLGLAGLGAGFVGLEALMKFPSNTTVGGAGLGALVVALLLAAALVVKTRREVIVDTKGVTMGARGKSIRILWSEPHALYYRAPDGDGTGAVERVLVTTEDGRRIDVGRVDVGDNPNVAVPRVVERYSTTASWSRTEQALEDGKPVTFGPVTLDQKSFDVAGHSFPMDGSLCIQVTDGKLRVGAKGKWTSTDVPVLEIANFQCLLRAIGQVSQARPPG